MGKIKLFRVVVVFILGGLAAGCATSADRAAFHQAQVDAIKAQVAAEIAKNPMIRIKAQQGQPIVLSGLAELEVYAPRGGSPEYQMVKQYQDEYLPVYISALNLLGIPISLGVQGYFFNEALKTTASHGQNITNYGANNSGLQGSGSGNVFASPGGAGTTSGQSGAATGASTVTTSNAPTEVQ